METIHVRIKGLSPILMHAYPMVPIEAQEKLPPEQQAEIAAYRDPETKNLYIPGVALQRALISGATFSKGKGRGSLQKIAAACVFVSPERVPILQGGKPVKEYVIDARPVVVPATKGRVIRYRPRFDEWEAEFGIDYDPTLLTEAQLRRIVDDTGSRVGILDFRPEKKGPFGRFMVTGWNAA